jgi:hypothetical protein
VRRIAVVLLLACLAFGAWWTATPRTAQQAIGWCMQEKGADIQFTRCGPSGRLRGKVVGVSPQLVDTVGEPRFGPFCPPETDDMARSPLPPGNTPWLCLDTQPGNGNVRG